MDDRHEVAQNQRQDTQAQNQADPIRFHASEAFEHHPQKRPEAGGFGCHGHKRGDGRGRALIHVRGPHVKRHGRDFESEPDDQQHQGHEHQRIVQAARIDRGGNLNQPRAAGRSENERNAIEQDSRGKRAQNKILGRGFHGLGFKPFESGHDVERDRHQLDAEVYDQQVRPGHHNHHAGQGEQHKPVEFGQVDPFFLEIADGEQHDHAAHDVEQ